MKYMKWSKHIKSKISLHDIIRVPGQDLRRDLQIQYDGDYGGNRQSTQTVYKQAAYDSYRHYYSKPQTRTYTVPHLILALGRAFFPLHSPSNKYRAHGSSAACRPAKPRRNPVASKLINPTNAPLLLSMARSATITSALCPIRSTHAQLRWTIVLGFGFGFGNC